MLCYVSSEPRLVPIPLMLVKVNPLAILSSASVLSATGRPVEAVLPDAYA